jgi:hypothetical protein
LRPTFARWHPRARAFTQTQVEDLKSVNTELNEERTGLLSEAEAAQELRVHHDELLRMTAALSTEKTSLESKVRA